MLWRCVKCSYLLLLLFVVVNLVACGPLRMRNLQDDPNRERRFALLLPLTGQHAATAAKIARGARCAEQELIGRGIKAKLVIFDTGKNDWIKRFRQLPDNYVVVGGPLELSAYKSAKAAHLFDKHVFYVFLNNLEGSDEGRLAYRFFPSTKDQINALLSFSENALKIKSFGAFYPTDAYGQRMVKLFEQEAIRRKLTFHKASYNPSFPSSWPSDAKNLINPVNAATNQTMPRTPFEAVFLPASWKHLDGLIKSFLHNGEDRLVMLGTMLWEQSLTARLPNNPQRFELAIFPSACNNQIKLPAAAGRNEFWVDLGYDFVQFASSLGLVSKPTQAEVIMRANKAARAIRTLAPFHWNDLGHASQKLYIYRLSAQGIVKVDPKFFNQLRQTRKANTTLRMQTKHESFDETAPASGSLGEIDESSRPKLQPIEEKLTPPQPKPRSSTNSPSPRTIMTNVPQSSHKLSLPTPRPTEP